MSLSINVGKIKSVLLADGWHACVEGSFYIDAYEYTGIINDEHFISAGVNGYSFDLPGEEGGRLFGPVEAILAVRT